MYFVVSQFSERFEPSGWILNFPMVVPPHRAGCGNGENSRHENPRLAVSPLRGVSHFRVLVQRAAHHAACANRKRRSSTGIRARRHVQTQIAILGVWRTGHKRCAPICAPAVPAVSALSVCSFPKSADFTGREWRPRPESNRGTRICSPMRHHSATWPLALSYHDRRRMKSGLVRAGRGAVRAWRSSGRCGRSRPAFYPLP